MGEIKKVDINTANVNIETLNISVVDSKGVIELLKNELDKVKVENSNLCEEMKNLNRKLDKSERENMALKQTFEAFQRQNGNLKLLDGERTHTAMAYDMRKAAKVLSDNVEGIVIGRNILLKCLRELEYLDDDNIPFQKFEDDKLFKVIATRSGSFYNLKTLITQKGIQKVAPGVFNLLRNERQA